MLFSHLVFVILYSGFIIALGHTLSFKEIQPEYFLPLMCFNLRYLKHPSSLLIACITGLGSDIVMHHSFPIHSCFYFCCHLLCCKLPVEIDKDSYITYIALIIAIFIPLSYYTHLIGYTKWTERAAFSCLIFTIICSPFFYFLYSIYARIFSHGKLIKKYMQNHA